MAWTTTVPALNRSQPKAARIQGSILVVDDDELICSLFLELFRQEGLSIRVATSGQEALAMVKQSSPSLLIVDVSLPDQDGITVLEEAQKIDNRTVGVVMTGSPSIELAVRAMKAGATEFLMKPIQNDVVLSTARRLLDLHQLRAENTVLKYSAVQSRAVRLHSPPVQIFGEDGALRGQDGLTDFERGLAEGEQRAEERSRQKHSLFVSAARKLDEVRTMLQQTIEDDVIALAFQIASKVLHESAVGLKEQIVIQAKSGIAAIQESGVVVIQVHPADVPMLESARAELMGQRDIAMTVKIESVPSLPPGSCLLHTANRLIDASLDIQLLRLGEALMKRNHRESR